MATRFEWIKLILDKWAVILPIILFIASATGLTFSMADNNDKDEEIEATQKQIATIANHYKATTPPKIVVQKSSCGNCVKIMKEYIDKQTKLHKKREH